MDTGLIIILLLVAGIIIAVLRYLLATPELTHAGVVVRRGAPGSYEYLFISPRSGGDKWVLPKGKIDPGETAEEAALRELKEESGYKGSIIADLGVKTLTRYGIKKILAHFFLVLPVEAKGESKEKRKEVWLTQERALGVKASDAVKAIVAEAATHP